MSSRVDAFTIDVHNVTNAAFMAFVEAGGYRDRAVVARRGLGVDPAEAISAPAVLGTDEGRVVLARRCSSGCRCPRAWPVYVTWAEARAYAAWRGLRLPTEAEFHRAAYRHAGRCERAPVSVGRRYRRRAAGNFDFERWDPEPVGAHPEGASAFGVHDLVGNGWEWTATVFAPFAGLRAAGVVSGVLRRLLRRRALRDEGRVAGDRPRAGAPRFPQLVQAALSVRLRDVPLRGRRVTPFDVRAGDLRRMFADGDRRIAAADAAAAPVEVFLRRARLGAVRCDLPAAVVSHHPRRVGTARPPRRARFSRRSPRR